ncbi:cytidine deaminase-like protein [Eremomyces bilateralis CBS 781.70]|uniref:Cytidine deaminase-like protein n=1 Tax=Eremomyces bilateralis CBS 781.70 TaxID=1392243 RepID=A0A6G1G7F9_9PEZI|nr:cytidine deaminase-like protein [Eremomyces bilateralis CBS 781.70]KAF1813779.1 cytidine deaminase-like protein [Eremomyces bilateralis CBS 781.70]
MHFQHCITSAILLAASCSSLTFAEENHQSPFIEPSEISFETRAFWIRHANDALRYLTPSPCPFEAFGTVIVNHSSTPPDSPHGAMVCIGANAIVTGNPTLHGEIAAINNCSAVLQSDPYHLSAQEALAAFADLSLYTNAEPCAMCATAIRWAGFKELIYGTGEERLESLGWQTVGIRSREVLERSRDLSSRTRSVGSVLSNETDPYFAWQFNPMAPCPQGCLREGHVCFGQETG